MKTINMLSEADSVPGQGVGSAYLEQVKLVTEGLKEEFIVTVNKHIKSDIVHYHSINLKFFIHSKRKNQGIKVGYVHFLPKTMEGSIKLPSLLKKLFYNYIIAFYRNMDYLVTVNSSFIKDLESYGFDPKKIFYVPNFVSRDKFHPLSEERIKQQKLSMGMDPDKFVVLGVGQIMRRKGVEDFLEIAKNQADIQFVWAGGFSFGKLSDGYENLKKQVENPPINVKFLGIVPREEMNSIYNMSNLLFMPSLSELFPMSILEAMNCHLPVLLRDIELYKEILEGYYLKGKDVEDFSKIIQELKNNTSFYHTAVKKSKNGGLFYSKEHVLSIWKDFYTGILKEQDGTL